MPAAFQSRHRAALPVISIPDYVPRCFTPESACSQKRSEFGAGTSLCAIGSFPPMKIPTCPSPTLSLIANISHRSLKGTAVVTLFAFGFLATASAITSNGTGGGNWSSNATWAGGVVPGAADDVTIANGDTVLVDTAAACNNLQVGQGTATSLRFDPITGRTLTAGGNVTVAA